MASAMGMKAAFPPRDRIKAHAESLKRPAAQFLQKNLNQTRPFTFKFVQICSWSACSKKKSQPKTSSSGLSWANMIENLLHSYVSASCTRRIQPGERPVPLLCLVQTGARSHHGRARSPVQLQNRRGSFRDRDWRTGRPSVYSSQTLLQAGDAALRRGNRFGQRLGQARLRNHTSSERRLRTASQSQLGTRRRP